MDRTTNSNHVGNTLRNALRTIHARQQVRVASVPQITTQKRSNKLPLRVALKRMPGLMARGAGVYENTLNGEIWHREGDTLIRQAVDLSSIVEKYLETVQGT